jgi:CelD/BcsL family acetyltransferase involved in cellulose biosynthesis
VPRFTSSEEGPAMRNGAVDNVREWSQAEFSAAGVAWEALLARSDADPLFMGWEWQSLWWEHHRQLLGGTLALLACYDGPKLVGLAPFYLHSAAHRAGLQGNRIELIGSNFRDGRGVFSEYLDLIADRDYAAAVAGAVARWLRDDRRWTDFVAGNSPAGGVASRLVREHLVEDCLVRETDPLESHRAELTGDFPAYLRSLAGGTRRKLWNHRSKLVDPELVIAGPDEVFRAFDLIDQFHRHRWNAPQYVGVARAFHFALAPALIARGALRLSTLYSGGAPLAVMYNVRLGATEYNIQSGFDPAQASGLSPGYLHFGYSLEEACRDGIRRFDFLAGEGRNRQYKQDFVTTESPLVTFHAVRAGYLKLLYRAHRFVERVRGAGAPATSA